MKQAERIDFKRPTTILRTHQKILQLSLARPWNGGDRAGCQVRERVPGIAKIWVLCELRHGVGTNLKVKEGGRFRRPCPDSATNLNGR
jgi:hypothetical protein